MLSDLALNLCLQLCLQAPPPPTTVQISSTDSQSSDAQSKKRQIITTAVPCAIVLLLLVGEHNVPPTAAGFWISTHCPSVTGHHNRLSCLALQDDRGSCKISGICRWDYRDSKNGRPHSISDCCHSGQWNHTPGNQCACYLRS